MQWLAPAAVAALMASLTMWPAQRPAQAATLRLLRLYAINLALVPPQPRQEQVLWAVVCYRARTVLAQETSRAPLLVEGGATWIRHTKWLLLWDGAVEGQGAAKMVMVVVAVVVVVISEEAAVDFMPGTAHLGLAAAGVPWSFPPPRSCLMAWDPAEVQPKQRATQAASRWHASATSLPSPPPPPALLV